MIRCVCPHCRREVFWLHVGSLWFLVEDERRKIPHQCAASDYHVKHVAA